MLIRLLCLLLITLAACSPARREVDTDLVARVKFEGNGGPLSGHNNYQLRSQMEQGTSSFGALTWPLMYFAEPVGLDRDALARDAYRLEVWYAHNGWFDARFSGWTLRRLRRSGKVRAGVVEIIGTVDPGEASLFESFEITGLDRTSQLFGNTVKRTGYVQPGGQFSLESVYLTRDQLIRMLHDSARAYASVDVDMTARPADREVEVRFDVDPGIVTTLGAVSVEGQSKIRDHVIRESLGFDEGDPYGISKLAKAQRRLFELGVFSVVNVTPELDDPSQDAVPVSVRVVETRFQRLRAGGGGDYDGQSFTPRLSLSYRHANLFNRLVRFETGGSAGVALGLGQSDATQPIYNVYAQISTPRFAGPDWSLALNGSVRQDLQNGQFSYLNPEASLDFGYQPSDHVAVGFGPRWQLYQFLDLEGPQQLFAARALFGSDFKNPYQLLTLEGRVSVDWRDDPIFTRRGSLWRASIRHALPVPANDLQGASIQGFHFTEISGDMRAYRPLRFKKRTEDLPWSWAGRLTGRVQQTWNAREIPYAERIFMGGATDVRGFRSQQIGPYDILCLYEPGRRGSFSSEPGAGLELNRTELPRGGRIAASGTLELRYDWAYGVTWAVFSDAGVLLNEWSEFAQIGQALRVSGGVGARYKSLIGPIRIDLSFRDLYPEDTDAPSYINCNREDPLPPHRNFDLLTAWRDGDKAPPLAVNLLVAIGEAL